MAQNTININNHDGPLHPVLFNPLDVSNKYIDVSNEVPDFIYIPLHNEIHNDQNLSVINSTICGEYNINADIKILDNIDITNKLVTILTHESYSNRRNFINTERACNINNKITQVNHDLQTLLNTIDLSNSKIIHTNRTIYEAEYTNDATNGDIVL